MLPLQGIPARVRGFEENDPATLLRLRLPVEEPSHSADVALVRSPSEAQIAVSNGFAGAIIIADDNGCFPSQEDLFSKVVTLPSPFAYLAGGDVLSLRPKQKRVRTLFRRRSKHNAFLVTERCNHYCLMCSQPPRNVDDSWLLDEIRSCLPLIDKATQSLGFTGGEPLLEWRRFLRVLGDCGETLPDTAIHVLSNGRAFADSEVVAAWSCSATSQSNRGNTDLRCGRSRPRLCRPGSGRF